MADVAVLGAGLAGASVAWWLRGRSVVVVEQGEQPGAEASAQNAGMQRRLVVDSVERALAVRAGRWYDALPAGFEPGAVRRTGGITALADDAHRMDAAVADLRAEGIPVDERASIFLDVRREWHVPEAMLDPTALISGFLREATVRLRTRARVAVAGGRVVGLDTPDGRIDADHVVVAGGAWAVAVSRDLGLYRPLRPLARHLFQTEPDPASNTDHPWCWVDDAGLYLRPEAGGWLCSPCDEVERHPVGPGSAGPTTADGATLLAEKLARFAPHLTHLGIRAGWTGLRTFTPDRRPLLGPDPEIEGLHWAVGLGGHGVTCAPAIGEVVADGIRGHVPVWIDVGALAPGRFPLPR